MKKAKNIWTFQLGRTNKMGKSSFLNPTTATSINWLKCFTVFPQSLLANSGIVPQTKPPQLPSTSFPIQSLLLPNHSNRYSQSQWQCYRKINKKKTIVSFAVLHRWLPWHFPWTSYDHVTAGLTYYSYIHRQRSLNKGEKDIQTHRCEISEVMIRLQR
jgi:hypothetical protein